MYSRIDVALKQMSMSVINYSKSNRCPTLGHKNINLVRYKEAASITLLCGIERRYNISYRYLPLVACLDTCNASQRLMIFQCARVIVYSTVKLVTI